MSASGGMRVRSFDDITLTSEATGTADHSEHRLLVHVGGVQAFDAVAFVPVVLSAPRAYQQRCHSKDHTTRASAREASVARHVHHVVATRDDGQPIRVPGNHSVGVTR